jgi:hypothetical protein
MMRRHQQCLEEQPTTAGLLSLISKFFPGQSLCREYGEDKISAEMHIVGYVAFNFWQDM